MNIRSKPLIVVSEEDRIGLGLRYAKHLFGVDAQVNCTVIDVNSLLDVYVDVLKDIIDEDELRTLVKEQRGAARQKWHAYKDGTIRYQSERSIIW